jgi:hypothetical protein
VRIHHHALRVSEADAHHHVGGLAADARQACERFQVGGDLAAVLILRAAPRPMSAFDLLRKKLTDRIVSSTSSRLAPARSTASGSGRRAPA